MERVEFELLQAKASLAAYRELLTEAMKHLERMNTYLAELPDAEVRKREKLELGAYGNPDFGAMTGWR